ncbi:MAG: ABC transporter substrate-binding protein, partial [Anaerolineales bacterium]
LGEITGNVEGAKAVVTDMQSRISAVAEKIGSVPTDKRPKVFYEVFDEPLTTTTNATFIGELLTLAGGVNIFAELPETYPNVSVEQIADLDPQIIIGPSSHADKLTAELIAARPGWGNLTAVKNKAVYIVDEDAISRAGPRVVEALEALAKALYPDLFGK